MFKSVQHSLNHQNLQLQKKNKKQVIKQYSKEELAVFAAQRGMAVSDKPILTKKRSVKEEVITEALNEIDFSALPQEVLELIGKK